ncbi:hypothetical protein N7456_003211 [Penicillium angulare]|uniref:Uncharacterized protein n=1 Tax=Penicillium angulare TaxID=116970 RepID=A0A9W9FU74_9EURO|nr:hypothetical protein N7456_003211 [Penicillium angulare]
MDFEHAVERFTSAFLPVVQVLTMLCLVALAVTLITAGLATVMIPFTFRAADKYGETIGVSLFFWVLFILTMPLFGAIAVMAQVFDL